MCDLERLEDAVIIGLRKAIKLGHTYIVTNAQEGWVEQSAERIFPTLYKKLIRNAKQNGITIISARSMFGAQMPRKLLFLNL